MPTYSRREQLSSLAAFGLAAAVAPASAYDIVPAAEIDRQLAALRAEADAASSGSPDGSYERPAADTPSAGKSSTGASSAACKSEEAGTPPALPQAAQLAVAGTVGIALLGSASLGFLAGSSKSADVSSRTLQSERLRFAEELSRLRSERDEASRGLEASAGKVEDAKRASALRLQASLKEFDALADERAHLEAGLSAAKDEILGLKAERESSMAREQEALEEAAEAARRVAELEDELSRLAATLMSKGEAQANALKANDGFDDDESE